MDRDISKNRRHSHGNCCTHRVSINGITDSVLNQLSHVIENKKLRIDTDLTQVSANVFQRFITNAVCRLIENAIEQSPEGGEVNITLVASDCEWELEIADSAIDPKAGARCGKTNNDFLDEVVHAAKLHGGQVKSFNCPQGGTANALVIPHNSTSVRLT